MSRTITKEKQKRISVLLPSASIDEAAAQNRKKQRVAAYCRVSTSLEEQLGSFVAQKDYFTKTLSANQDYCFVGIYADEGISGTDVKKREGFQQMMRDCRAGKLDMIITKSISRFGRNTVDCLNAIRDLKALGINVFFEKENIHTMRSEGELLLTLMMAFAEAESVSLSENVKWGMRKKVEQGSGVSVLSGIPYGYDKVAGELVINETKSIVVRRIYQDFLDGYSYTDIARRLNEEGISTYFEKGQWVNVSIKQMLENEKYRGDTCYQKSYVVDPISKKKKKNKGSLPRYYLTETHPPIIEPGLWECVQLEIKRRNDYTKTHHTQINNPLCVIPLLGKIICQECGYSFTSRSHSPYLFCNAYVKLRHAGGREKLACHQIRLDKAIPEKTFITAWNRLVDKHNWQETLQDGDVLRAYRLKELTRLVKESDHIEKMPYELMLKTLDHIEIGLGETAEVVFLAGVRIKLEI